MARPWSRTQEGVVLRIHLQPRATRNRLIGLHGEALKIALTAPPIDGAANAALVSFLAALLQVPRSSVTLLTGATSREKRVQVKTATPEQILRQLQQALPQVDKLKGDG
jgi:uncharacterized protein (TIGR00251 family)